MKGFLYPLLFEPNLHEVVWGGQKLTAWKGLAVKDHIGESWEVSCVAHSPSVIANGTWTGYTINEEIPIELLVLANFMHKNRVIIENLGNFSLKILGIFH